jgi:hypothetical protein
VSETIRQLLERVVETIRAMQLRAYSDVVLMGSDVTDETLTHYVIIDAAGNRQSSHATMRGAMLVASVGDQIVKLEEAGPRWTVGALRDGLHLPAGSFVGIAGVAIPSAEPRKTVGQEAVGPIA